MRPRPEVSAKGRSSSLSMTKNEFLPYGLDPDIRRDDEVLEPKSFVPKLFDETGSYGAIQLVMHGVQTNKFCGTYAATRGCLRTDLHDKIRTLDGVSYKGKIYRKFIHNSCGKPSCPVCMDSWRARESRKIEQRLGKAAVQYGQAEHLFIGLPVEDWELPYAEQRKKAWEAARRRGFIGGAMIYHGARFNLLQRWYLGVHFHLIGFFEGGYKCRGCKRSALTSRASVANFKTERDAVMNMTG